MNVLLLGGTRNVGYLLTWRLLAAGHRVTHFNRGTMPDPFGDRIERIRGDRTRLADLGEYDAAVDFSAYVPADLEALPLDRLGHYVFISTGQVYLVRRDCPVPAREEDYDGPLMPRPEDPDDRREWEYGVGKRGCEDRLARATRLRLPMVNGERDHYRRMESYLWRLLDGGPVLLPDGGRRVRHVYSGSVVECIASLLGDRRTLGRAYNLAQDETPALAEMVAMLAELLGARSRIVPVDSGIAPRGCSPFSTRWMSFLDPSRAKAEIGFRHAPLREYLGRIVAAFLAHPPASPPDDYAGRREEIALAEGLCAR